MVELSLRDATRGDYDFLYELHRAALKETIERTWGWDEDWQAERFRSKFDVTRRRIILQDGEHIGCLAVVDQDDGIFLSYLALMPDHQGQGIGTWLIRDVLDQARAKGVAVTLRVLRTNPARALYERLGFRIYETTETHHLMISHPNSEST